MKKHIALCAVVLVFGGMEQSMATPVFHGPIHYQSQADIPAGFYASGSPTGLEDFEDLSLDFGITASAGSAIGPGGLTDSVDGDDGSIDGSGTNGHSFFSGSGATGIKFTFSSPVTAAGIVWTDGAGTTTFEAFGPGDTSLGTIGPVLVATSGITGQTDEDSFFGVTDLGGITAIKLSNTSGGIEIDHVQFGDAAVGNAVPEPATVALLGLGLAGLGFGCRKRPCEG